MMGEEVNAQAYYLAEELAQLVCETVSQLVPGDFRLIGGMCGAAAKAFNHVAECCQQSPSPESLQACRLAQGALSELGGYLELCRVQRMLPPMEEAALVALFGNTLDSVARLIQGFPQKKTNGNGNGHGNGAGDGDEGQPCTPSSRQEGTRGE